MSVWGFERWCRLRSVWATKEGVGRCYSQKKAAPRDMQGSHKRDNISVEQISTEIQ